MRNMIGPKTLPRLTSALTIGGDEGIPLTMRVEEASDPTGGGLGCHRQRERESLEIKARCRTVKYSKYVQIDGPDHISNIEAFNPLWGEERQHFHGGVTQSESETTV